MVNAGLTTHSSTVSSKADIFEAKIASAVDEANSSDSEETFVYESNPPEPSNHLRRYHSRTPSVTSMASQADRGMQRSIHGGDGQHSVAPKKSMKFSNAYSAMGLETATGEDDGRGTGRSNMGTGRGSSHHHHIGRWGRNTGNGHPSLFDNESPFPNVTKAKVGASNSRNSSRPNSPKAAKFMNGKRSLISANYDIDEGAGADDEQTPLIGPGPRSLRIGRNRRPGSSSLRHYDHRIHLEDNSLLSRFSGCLILLLAMLLVVGGGFCFVYATTQPLSEVHVLALKNVLVSQQELMLDIEVTAQNPNVVAVTVDSMNIEVFARSRHAEDWDWWRIIDPPSTHMRRVRRSVNALAHTHDDDPLDSPHDGTPDETQTLKLGRLLEFDSPLTFEGMPLSKIHGHATGGVRLANPGNTTENGGAEGMEKWAQIVKYEFDLRIKGVLEYQLPLSQRIRKASVDFATMVKPGKGTTRPDEGDEHGHGRGRTHEDFEEGQWGNT